MLQVWQENVHREYKWKKINKNCITANFNACQKFQMFLMFIFKQNQHFAFRFLLFQWNYKIKSLFSDAKLHFLSHHLLFQSEKRKWGHFRHYNGSDIKADAVVKHGGIFLTFVHFTTENYLEIFNWKMPKQVRTSFVSFLCLNFF